MSQNFVHILFPLIILTFAPPIEAQSNITFTNDEMIIDLRQGPPVLHGEIEGERYKFLISPATHIITVPPDIAETYVSPKLKFPFFKIPIDHKKIKPTFGRLKIDFPNDVTRKDNAYWLDDRVPYEDYDGIIDAFGFKKDKVTFILESPNPDKPVKAQDFKSESKVQWIQQQKKLINGENILISFRPYYDKTRITIGTAYALEEGENIEYNQQVFRQYRDYVGVEEFVTGHLPTPLFPLHSDRPIKEVQVHILKGSFDPRSTEIGADEVVATGKSNRKYTKIIWLGRDHFKGCERIEFKPKKKLMTTYCAPNAELSLEPSLASDPSRP